MEIVRIYYTGRIGYVFLIWNLFLAWISLGLALLLRMICTSPKSAKKKVLLTCIGLLWIAFYPNAPYMITDFIHLRMLNFGDSYSGYAMSYMVWYDFVMIVLFIITGVFVGFTSLFIIHRLLKRSFNAMFTWCLVAGILYVSSFGIYLGRFIRWNTWDIMANPNSLFQSILNNSSNFMIFFTLLFGTLLLLIYTALYSLTRPFSK